MGKFGQFFIERNKQSVLGYLVSDKAVGEFDLGLTMELDGLIKLCFFDKD